MRSSHATGHTWMRCALLVNPPNKFNLLLWLLTYLCNKKKCTNIFFFHFFVKIYNTIISQLNIVWAWAKHYNLFDLKLIICLQHVEREVIWYACVALPVERWHIALSRGFLPRHRRNIHDLINHSMRTVLIFFSCSSIYSLYIVAVAEWLKALHFLILLNSHSVLDIYWVQKSQTVNERTPKCKCPWVRHAVKLFLTQLSVNGFV